MKRIFILLFSLTFVLSACDLGEMIDEVTSFFNDDTTEEQTNNNNEQNNQQNNTEENNESNNDDNGTSEDENTNENENTTEVNHSPRTPVNHIDQLLQNMKNAINTVQSISMTSTSLNYTKSIFENSEETIETNVQVILSPEYIQHGYQVIEGETDTNEWYATQEAFYISPPHNGWFKGFNVLEVDFAHLYFNAEQIDHIFEHRHVFDYTEDADHYIITFVGTDEQYKEILFDDVVGIAYGDELQEIFDALFEVKEMSGDYEMKISKDTFLLVESNVSQKLVTTFLFGLETEVLAEATSYYSYNDVNSIEIPEEVIRTAVEADAGITGF